MMDGELQSGHKKPMSPIRSQPTSRPRFHRSRSIVGNRSRSAAYRTLSLLLPLSSMPLTHWEKRDEPGTQAIPATPLSDPANLAYNPTEMPCSKDTRPPGAPACAGICG